MKAGVLLVGFLLLAGCASVGYRGATVYDGLIENPALGFFGFSYQIPEGYELYNPALANSAYYNDLQKLSLRIYDLNRRYHPRGDELFYESFLMLSDHTAFLLITVKTGRAAELDVLWPDEVASPEWQLMPLYNVIDSRPLKIGEARHDAVWSVGRAFERKGWHYADAKPGRMEFAYEACKVSGVNHDSYILIGFCRPEHSHILQLQMKDMMAGFRF